MHSRICLAEQNESNLVSKLVSPKYSKNAFYNLALTVQCGK